MAQRDGFWKLEHLSDAQLLESLGGVLLTQRGALAEIVAHLAEVEERRLHLQAAYGSMFAYCVARLGMSEDEACRRIELARLARRFPALFVELASGRITLSVALLLKPMLSSSNHLELLALARGKCMRQVRELLAERFPRADAPSSIRKLPQPRAAVGPTRAGSEAPEVVQPDLVQRDVQPDVVPVAQAMPALRQPERLAASSQVCDLSPGTSLPMLPTASLSLSAPSSVQAVRPVPAPSLAEPSPCESSARSASRSVIEPLSARRYRVQFTADLELKEKLELARQLLRHAHPGGDLAPIVSRALDLLIEQVLRRRFGVKRGRRGARSASKQGVQSSSADKTTRVDAHPSAPASAAMNMPVNTSMCKHRPHVSRPARRAVLERDGLGCSWIDGDGKRCGSRAWLELDHREPAGKGGGCEPDNLRLLCRAHNRFAAERAYGREHIERMSAQRRQAHAIDPPAGV